MTQHTARRLSWSLWILTLVLTVMFVVLVLLSRGSPGPLEFASAPLLSVVYGFLILLFSSIGSLVAARHPANVIGWMFCFTGIAVALGMCAQLYADYALVHHPGSVPGGELAAWLSSWLIIAGLFVTPIFLLFLFPTGRPASPRWRPVVALAVVVVVIGFTGAMFKPGPIDPFDSVTNPLALPGWAGRTMDAIESLFTLSATPFFLVGAVALVARMRGSRGEQRQQLKWFAYVASMMGVSFAATFMFSGAGLLGLGDLFFILGAVSLVCIPIACGVAILKYRLYGIDLIINRTLVYGSLTAVLVLVYVAGVVGLGGALRELTGQQDNNLAVAASTLAVAALFRPARSRIQGFIDRRFYRRKYDAAQTLESFSARLRDEIDLDELSADLLTAIKETMQPAHASLWLRSEVGG
jgi:hypothetical protein